MGDEIRLKRWDEVREHVLTQWASGGCVHLHAEVFRTVLAGVFDAGMAAEREAAAVPPPGARACPDCGSKTRRTRLGGACCVEELDRTRAPVPPPGARADEDDGGPCSRCGRLRHLHPSHPDCRVWIPAAAPIVCACHDTDDPMPDGRCATCLLPRAAPPGAHGSSEVGT